MIRVQICEEANPDMDSLNDHIKWLNEHLEKVPYIFQDECQVQIYDTGYEIYYFRPETKEEEAARLAEAERVRKDYMKVGEGLRKQNYKILKAEAEEKGWDNETSRNFRKTERS